MTTQAISDNEKHDHINDVYEANNLSLEVVEARALWPFPSTPLTAPSLAAQLVRHLPSFQRATTLIEAYFSDFAWVCIPIDHEQAHGELLSMFYSHAIQNSPYSPDPSAQAVEHPHELALLFSLLACGVLGISYHEPETAEARKYWDLARASFSLRSFVEDDSLSACQALSLLSAAEAFMNRGQKESILQNMSLALILACHVSAFVLPNEYG